VPSAGLGSTSEVGHFRHYEGGRIGASISIGPPAPERGFSGTITPLCEVFGQLSFESRSLALSESLNLILSIEAIVTVWRSSWLQRGTDPDPAWHH
ncbi:MAG TPA: hypothetical protein VKP30_06435, partial [Polyangiaceae bacterium]|nr:hypothetical protein [Polyangiaceae bacterium]